MSERIRKKSIFPIFFVGFSDMGIPIHSYSEYQCNILLSKIFKISIGFL